MVRVIILTAIILAVIYFFLFRSTRNRRKKEYDNVADYRELYLEKKSLHKYKNSLRENAEGQTGSSFSIYSGESGATESSRPYITRYNSTEDYREK